MKKRMGRLLAGMLLLLLGWCAAAAGTVTPAQAEPARHGEKIAAVRLTDDPARSGAFLYQPVFLGECATLAELPGVLKKYGFSRVVLSSWARRGGDYQPTLEALKAAGIEVVMCYVLAEGRPDWDRVDLIGLETAEPETFPDPVWSRLLIEDNAYNRRYKLPGKMKSVEFITIHNTAEPFSARQERDRVDFRRDRASVSFHYAVDEDEIVQILPLDLHGWHAGDGAKGPGNARSIGIEICRSQCRGPADWRYRRAEANAVKLAAFLLKKFNLGVDALRMHQDWSGKFCPHRILEEKRWASFRERTAEALKR